MTKLTNGIAHKPYFLAKFHYFITKDHQEVYIGLGVKITTCVRPIKKHLIKPIAIQTSQ